MRTRYLLSALLTGVAANSSFAQAPTTTTGTTSTTTTQTGQTGTGSGLGTGTPASDFQIQQMATAVQVTGGPPTGSTLSPTNALSQYYANPQFQGRAGATGQDAPGGFGSPLAGTASGGSRAVGTSGLNPSRTGGSGTTSGGFGGTAGRTTTGANSVSTTLGRTTGTGGQTRTGGLAGGGLTGGGLTGLTGGLTGGRQGGATGLGGRTGGGFGGTASQQNGAVIPLPRAISYTMTVRMPALAVNTPQMQADLRGILDRSRSLSNPRGIDVSMNGETVVLRGTVKDEDEAKTAEGMIRLTPGVKQVKNELKY